MALRQEFARGSEGEVSLGEDTCRRHTGWVTQLRLARSKPVNSPSLKQYRLRRCDRRATVACCGKLCPGSSGDRQQRSLPSA